MLVWRKTSASRLVEVEDTMDFTAWSSAGATCRANRLWNGLLVEWVGWGHGLSRCNVRRGGNLPVIQVEPFAYSFRLPSNGWSGIVCAKGIVLAGYHPVVFSHALD